MKLKYLFLCALVLAFFSCGDGEEDPMVDECNTDNITYTNTVATIFNSTCATPGCHVGPNTATFPLENYAQSVLAVGFGQIVDAINHASNVEPMPRGADKLEQCDIDKITAWINAGAPE